MVHIQVKIEKQDCGLLLNASNEPNDQPLKAQLAFSQDSFVRRWRCEAALRVERVALREKADDAGVVPQGKLKSAEEFYKYAVQLVDDYTPAHQGLAQLRLQSGNPREVRLLAPPSL